MERQCTHGRGLQAEVEQQAAPTVGEAVWRGRGAGVVRQGRESIYHLGERVRCTGVCDCLKQKPSELRFPVGVN